MKKLNNSVSRGLIAVLVMLACSCRKDLREVEVATATTDDNSVETASACSVVSIKGTDFDGNFQKAVFTYDSYGNPVSMILDHTDEGLVNYAFRYDTKHRVIDLIGYYDDPNGIFEIWHNYHYNSKHQINADTVYTLGEFGEDGQPKNYFDKYLVHFTYDSFGRIIKEKDSYGDAYHYKYDSNGNLADGSTYDHKKNINSTNPIWQFINRDYSVNNALPTLDYAHGYPAKIDWYLKFMDTYWWDSSTTTIKYSCN